METISLCWVALVGVSAIEEIVSTSHVGIEKSKLITYAKLV